MPFLVFVIVLFIGLGRTMVARQHGLVAARYAVFYEKVSGAPPPGTAMDNAVSLLGEPWEQRPQGADNPDDMLHGGEGHPGLQENLGFAGAAGNILAGFIGGNSKTIHQTLVHHPTEGTVARFFRPDDVVAEFTMPTGTMTSCRCGTFLELVLDKLPWPFRMDVGERCE